MRKDISVGNLERALLDLGFVVSRVKGSHKTYRHPPSGANILLPWTHRNQTVRPAYLVSVKRTLSEMGVLDRDLFDSLLEKAARRRP